VPAMPAMSPSRLLHLGIAVVAVAAAAAILFCFVALARVVCVSRSSLSCGRAGGQLRACLWAVRDCWVLRVRVGAGGRR